MADDVPMDVTAKTRQRLCDGWATARRLERTRVGAVAAWRRQALEIVEEERLAMSTSRARRFAPKSFSTVVVTLSMLPAELLVHVLTFLLVSEAARAFPAFPWLVRAMAVKKGHALAELMVRSKCDDVAFLYQEGPVSPL